MIFAEHDDGASVPLHPGESLTVRLAENPTTGYRWHPEDWDRSALELTGDEYHPSEGARPGAGGEREWQFVARRPGAVLLRLAYRRSWSTDNPAKTFSLSITVG